MIRAFADGEPPIYIFGLSAENIRRLTDFLPVVNG